MFGFCFRMDLLLETWYKLRNRAFHCVRFLGWHGSVQPTERWRAWAPYYISPREELSSFLSCFLFKTASPSSFSSPLSHVSKSKNSHISNGIKWSNTSTLWAFPSIANEDELTCVRDLITGLTDVIYFLPLLRQKSSTCKTFFRTHIHWIGATELPRQTSSCLKIRRSRCAIFHVWCRSSKTKRDKSRTVTCECSDGI